MLPIGNVQPTASQRQLRTPSELGAIVREAREAHGLTQDELALAAGTGRRFIGDLERGKPTAQIGPALRVLESLGIEIGVEGAPAAGDGHGAA